jgi:hypothetical protein
MLFPQGIFYPQGAFGPHAFQSNPQGFYPQGTFGPQAFQSSPGNIPFANTLYGYPQQTFAQGLPSWSNWQHPSQQAVQQQAALQQQAIQQLLAHQLATQQLAALQPSAMNSFNGVSNGAFTGISTNGAAQPIGAWAQQPNPEQFNPAVTPRHHLLQQLAQYHYLVSQQLAQQAAQQAVLQGAGQFIPGPLGVIPGQLGVLPGQLGVIPGQLGANFVSGITMH